MYFKGNTPMATILGTSSLGSYHIGIKIESSVFFFGFSIVVKSRPLGVSATVTTLSSWLPDKVARARSSTTVADVGSDFKGIKGFTYYSGRIPSYGDGR